MATEFRFDSFAEQQDSTHTRIEELFAKLLAVVTGARATEPPDVIPFVRLPEPPDQQPVATPLRGWTIPPSLIKAPPGINPYAIPRLRLEPPRFDGENAQDWICNIQRYYNHQYTPLVDRLYLTQYLFDHPASDWMEYWVETNNRKSLEDFLLAVKQQFDPEFFDISAATASPFLGTGWTGRDHRKPKRTTASPVINREPDHPPPQQNEEATQEVFSPKFCDDLFDVQPLIAIKNGPKKLIGVECMRMDNGPNNSGGNAVIDAREVTESDFICREAARDLCSIGVVSSDASLDTHNANTETINVEHVMVIGALELDDSCAVDNKVIVDTIPIEPASTKTVVLISEQRCALDDLLELELEHGNSSPSNYEKGQQLPVSKEEQSQLHLIQSAPNPLMTAFLWQSDINVRVGVASCISEITRITSPNTPYNDDRRKDVFRWIISPFKRLDDIHDHNFLEGRVSSALSNASMQWGREIVLFCANNGVHIFDPGDIEPNDSLFETVLLQHDPLWLVQSSSSQEGYIGLFDDDDDDQPLKGSCISHSSRLLISKEDIKMDILESDSSANDSVDFAYFVGIDASCGIGWRYLYIEATTFHAEKASRNYNLLVRFLSAASGDYVELVEAPIFAAANYRIVYRHPLLFGTRLAPSEVSNRGVDSVLLHILLHEAINSDLEVTGDEIVGDDSSNFEGGRFCAASASREFDGVVLNIVDEAGQDLLYMLKTVQAPLQRGTSIEEDTGGTPSVKTDQALNLESASAEEGLAVHVALEIERFDSRKSAAKEVYVAACRKLCVLLQFWALEHGVITLIFFYNFALRTRRFSWEGELIGTRTTPAATRAHPTKPAHQLVNN